VSRQVTIERVESYLPARTLRIEELGEHLGLKRAELGVFRKFYGLDTLRFDPDLDLIDLVRPSARKALDALPADGRIEYLVYAHTTQAVAPAHLDMAQLIRDDLGLAADTDAFALSHQACVSSLGGIDVVGELLRAEASAGAYALMVTGEKAYSPIVQHVPNTAIMADAAAACLVTLDGAGDRVLSFATRTYGQYAAWLELTAEQSHEFGAAYATRIAEIIHIAVDEAGLTFDDIDLVVPHNVNMLAWRQAIKELGVESDRVFLDNVPRYSHTFSADVFVNYTTLREQGRLTAGGRYVLVSVGLGATFGAMVIEHHEVTDS
jgi:3-oxoacyl-[acyl-carrier-protein] synthase-3